MTNSESRTSKSIKNAQVAMFYYVVQLILSFWSRKTFFQYLGAEVIGLDTTASNLFSFLSIAEMGVGTAVAYFLYQPLHDKETETINRIVALQGWIYKRVALIVIIGAFILMGFFPVIFQDITIPLWYAYATFGSLLLNSMLGYFLNYKSIVLSCNQKGYKVTRVTTGLYSLVKAIEIICLPLVPNPFIFYISCTIISTFFSCWWLNWVLAKEYPWLNTKGYQGKELLKEFPDVFKKTKQIFIHKISSVILSNVSPLLMFAYSSLTIVSYYSNYLIIVSNIRSVIGMVYSSVGNAIGDLVASKDKEKIIRVFWELYDSRFCISFVALICIYFLADPFITLWLGDEYIIPHSLLILLIIDQSIILTRITVDHYINGHGLFGDVWAPGVEGFINIVGALGFGALFGYQGVIFGNIISQLLIICLWKPVYLFKKGLHISAWTYFKPVILRHILVIIDIIFLSVVFRLIIPNRFDNYIEFFIYATVVLVIVTFLLFGEFFTFSEGVRDFVTRFMMILKSKFRKTE